MNPICFFFVWWFMLRTGINIIAKTHEMGPKYVKTSLGTEVWGMSYCQSSTSHDICFSKYTLSLANYIFVLFLLTILSIYTSIFLVLAIYSYCFSMPASHFEVRMYVVCVFVVEQTNNRVEYYCEKLLFIRTNIYLSGLFTRLPLAQLMQ